MYSRFSSEDFFMNKKNINMFDLHKCITCIVMTSDCQRIICSCRDNSLEMIYNGQMTNYPCDIDEDSKKKQGNFIKTMIITPNQKNLITGDCNSFIRVWDVITIEAIKKIKINSNSINSLLINPLNVSQIISADSDNCINIWDLKENKLEITLKGHTDWVLALEISIYDENPLLFSGSADKSINIWDFITYKLLYKLEGHQNYVSCLKLASQQIILSGSYDHTIKVWDIKQRKILYSFEKHFDIVTSLSIFPNCEEFVSSSADKTIRKWTLNGFKELGVFEAHTNWVTSLLIRDDEVIVSAGADGKLKIWYENDDNKLGILEGHTDWVTSIIISKDGRKIVSGSVDKTVRIWDFITHKKIAVLSGHTDWVTCVLFSDDENYIYSGSVDKTIKIWDVSNYKNIASFEGNQEWVTTMALNKEGNLLYVGGSDKLIRIIELVGKNYVLKEVIEGHSNLISCLLLTQNEELLISSSFDQTIRIWNFSNKNEARILKGHLHWVTSIVLTPDNKKLISGSRDNTIKLWSLTEFSLLNTIGTHSNWVYSLGMTSDGLKLVSGGRDKTIKIWDMLSLKEIKSIEGSSDWIFALAIAPNNLHLVAGSKFKNMTIWSLNECETCAILEEHTEWVNALAITPDNSLLITGSFDKTIRIWDINERKGLGVLLGHNDWVITLVISVDGIYLYSGGLDCIIIKWNIKDKTIISRLKGHLDWISSLVINETILISSSADKTIRIWDPIKCTVLSIIEKAHEETIHVIKLTPDGKRLLSGGSDNLVKIWDLKNNTEICCFDEHDDWVTSIAISPNGKKALTASKSKYEKFIVRDLDTLNLINDNAKLTNLQEVLKKPPKSNLLKAPGNKKNVNMKQALITAALFTKTDEIVTGDSEGMIKFWELDGLLVKKSIQAHVDTIITLALSNDGFYVISSSRDKTIKITDCYTKVCTPFHHQTEIVTALCFTSDGRLLTGGNDSLIKVWSLQNVGKVYDSWKGHKNSVIVLKVTSDNVKAISGSKDKVIILWDTSSGRILKTFEGHSEEINILEIDLTNQFLFSASADKTIRKWNLNTPTNFTKVLVGHEDKVTCLSLNKNGNYLGSGSQDKSIRIWDAIDFSQKMILLGHNTAVTCCKISEDDSLIISGSIDQMVGIWDAVIGTLLKFIFLQESLTSDTFFLTNNGRLIFFNGKIYDIFNGNEIFAYNYHWKNVRICHFSQSDWNFYSLSKQGELIKHNRIMNYVTHQLSVYSLSNILSSNSLNLKQKKSYIDAILENDLKQNKYHFFPFYFSSLHWMAINNDNDVCERIALFDKKEIIDFSLVLRQDLFCNSVLDILIKKKNKAAFEMILNIIFKQFDLLSFSEKYSFYSHSINSDKNIVDILLAALEFFSENTNLLSKLLEYSFFPLEHYQNDLFCEEMDQPNYLIIENISCIDKSFLKHSVSSFKNLNKNKSSFLKCKVLCIPSITDFHQGKVANFFKKLSSLSSDNEIFRNEALQIIVKYKWKKYAMKFYLFEAFFFFIGLLIYILKLFWFEPFWISQKEYSSYKGLTIFCDSYLLFFSIYQAYHEFLQIKRLGLEKYGSSIWNYIDWLLIILLIITCVLDLSFIQGSFNQIDVLTSFNSFTMFFYWIRLISFARGFQGTGFMIRLIVRVIEDVKYFLLIVFLFVLAFSFSIYVLQYQENYNILYSFFLVYRLMLGDFSFYDPFKDDLSIPGVMWFIFFISTILLLIILLNLIIAILSDTFSKVLSAEEPTKIYELANIVYEIDCKLSLMNVKRLKDKKIIGKYLIFLYNDNHIEKNQNQNDEIKILFQAQKNDLDEIKKKISNLENLIKQKFVN